MFVLRRKKSLIDCNELTKGTDKTRPWPALVVIVSVKNPDLRTAVKVNLQAFIQSP